MLSKEWEIQLRMGNTANQDLKCCWIHSEYADGQHNYRIWAIIISILLLMFVYDWCPVVEDLLHHMFFSQVFDTTAAGMPTYSVVTAAVARLIKCGFYKHHCKGTAFRSRLIILRTSAILATILFRLCFSLCSFFIPCR